MSSALSSCARSGTSPGGERELQAAQRQFTEIGAEAHAARLRDELAISDQ